MKKHGYLIDQTSSNGHYSYVKKGEVVYLFYSAIGDWALSTKGKLALILESTQNGDFTAKFMDGKEVTLDICQLAELIQAAEIYHRCGTKNTFTRYKLVKEIK